MLDYEHRCNVSLKPTVSYTDTGFACDPVGHISWWTSEGMLGNWKSSQQRTSHLAALCALHSAIRTLQKILHTFLHTFPRHLRIHLRSTGASERLLEIATPVAPPIEIPYSHISLAVDAAGLLTAKPILERAADRVCSPSSLATLQSKGS